MALKLAPLSHENALSSRWLKLSSPPAEAVWAAVDGERRAMCVAAPTGVVSSRLKVPAGIAASIVVGSVWTMVLPEACETDTTFPRNSENEIRRLARGLTYRETDPLVSCWDLSTSGWAARAIPS